MKNDYILRDLLYSDHTVFIHGDLVPIEGHEELSFLTVETKHVSSLTCAINPAMSENEIIHKSLERQAKDIAKL
jgi:hypothetical protein